MLHPHRICHQDLQAGSDLAVSRAWHLLYCHPGHLARTLIPLAVNGLQASSPTIRPARSCQAEKERIRLITDVS